MTNFKSLKKDTKGITIINKAGRKKQHVVIINIHIRGLDLLTARTFLIPSSFSICGEQPSHLEHQHSTKYITHHEAFA